MRTIDIVKKLRLDEIRFEHTEITSLQLYDFVCLIDGNGQSGPIFQFDLTKNATTKNSSAKEDYPHYLDHIGEWTMIKISGADFNTIIKAAAIKVNPFACTLRIYHSKLEFSDRGVSARFLSTKEIVFTPS